MNAFNRVLFCCLFLIFFDQSIAQQLDHVQGEILIQVPSEYTERELANTLFLEESGLTKVTSIPMHIWLYRFDFAAVSEDQLIDRLYRNGKTIAAQKNHILTDRNTPNDPGFIDQWQYINLGNNNGVVGADIDMDLAWDITTGGVTAQGDTIVACVIDDGLDPSHQDFEGNLWVNHNEIPDNGIDDDNNGYVDDYDGWDTYNDNGNIYTGGGHGTPVAGIVGAKGNNELGVAGVNWDVKLMIVRGGGNEANALASYAFPYYFRKLYNDTDGAEGAFVVSTNASWGTDFGQPEDAPIWCSFYDSLGVQGILSCGATINNNTNVDEEGDLPTACSSDYLISVTNMNRTDNKVTGAGYGAETIDLGAFGAETYTAAFGNSYGGFGGTSGATPHVTGSIALLYSLPCSSLMDIVRADPAAGALLVKEYILNGVDQNESLQGITTTGGRLNVFNSLNLGLANCGGCLFPLGAEINDITNVDATVTWTSSDSSDIDNIRIKRVSETTWDTILNVQSPLNLTDLSPCDEYEIQLQSICESEDGDFGFSQRFYTEGCCEAPTDLIVTLNDASADLSWTEEFGATEYNIEYKKTTDPDWIITTVTNNEYTITPIEECTSYDVRLQVQCDTLPSEYTDILSFTGSCGLCSSTNYCDFSEAGIDSDFEYIAGVQVGTLNNISINETDGYNNYLGLDEVLLDAGVTYNIVLTPGFQQFQFSEFFGVWIDFNQDEQFQEDEQVVAMTESTTTSYTQDILIPSNALEGRTKMRVVMSYDTQARACPFNAFDFGEVEDYCVTIGPYVPVCNIDLLPSVVENVTDGLTITWIESDAALSYNTRYKLVEETNWIEVNLMQNIITLTDLEVCKDYDFQVRSICETDTSDYSSNLKVLYNCPSNVDNLENSIHTLVVSPNPFNDALSIISKESINAFLQVIIMDVNGRTVYEATNQRMINNKLSIDKLHQLDAGVYLIKVSSKDFIKTYKTIKI